MMSIDVHITAEPSGRVPNTGSFKLIFALAEPIIKLVLISDSNLFQQHWYGDICFVGKLNLCDPGLII